MSENLDITKQVLTFEDEREIRGALNFLGIDCGLSPAAIVKVLAEYADTIREEQKRRRLVTA